MIKLENKGFSLVELIVVIMIVGILSVSTVAIVAMYSADVDKEAEIISANIDRARVKSMSLAGDVVAHIYTKDSKQYIDVEQSGAVEPLSSEEIDAEVLIYYSVDGINENELSILGEDGIKILFSKASGAVTATLVGGILSADILKYLKLITNETLYVCLVEDTGRNYIDVVY